MIRRIIPVVITVLLASSCGNKTSKEVTAGDKAVKVEFASLVADPADFIDKNIVVEGKVVHVCRETGRKLFIIGDDPDIRLFVSAGENMPKFPMELLGTRISVEGRIEKVATSDKPAEGTMVDSTDIAACCDSTKEATIACCDSSKKAEPTCESEAALVKQTPLGDLMMIYNKHEVVK